MKGQKFCLKLCMG